MVCREESKEFKSTPPFLGGPLLTPRYAMDTTFVDPPWDIQRILHILLNVRTVKQALPNHLCYRIFKMGDPILYL